MVISSKVIALCVIFLVGLWFGKKICVSTIKVEFEVQMLEVFFCSFMIFLFTAMVVLLELDLSWEWKNHVLEAWNCRIVNQLLEAGVLYIILVPITSVIYGTWIKHFNIDLCYSYNVKVFNIWYSVTVISSGIWLYMWKERYHLGDDLDTYIIFRIIMWIFGVVSTWLGAGTGCKGRICEDKKNTDKNTDKNSEKESSEEKGDIGKEKKYLIPCVAAYVLGALVLYYALGDISVWECSWMPYFVSMYAGTLIWILIYNCCYYPSARISDILLEKAIEQIKSGAVKQANKRYQTVKYSLVNDNSCKRIIIHEKKIDCAKEAEEIKGHFTNIVKDLEKFDYDECKQILSNTVEERSDAIRHGRKLCEDERIKRLKEIR